MTEFRKPIVHYVGLAVPRQYADGFTVFLRPIDHGNHLPGHSVSNTRHVETSGVVSWDETTGRIETMNTVYMPAETP